jgi:hypothetical protein
LYFSSRQFLGGGGSIYEALKYVKGGKSPGGDALGSVTVLKKLDNENFTITNFEWALLGEVHGICATLSLKLNVGIIDLIGIFVLPLYVKIVEFAIKKIFDFSIMNNSFEFFEKYGSDGIGFASFSWGEDVSHNVSFFFHLCSPFQLEKGARKQSFAHGPEPYQC